MLFQPFYYNYIFILFFFIIFIFYYFIIYWAEIVTLWQIFDFTAADVKCGVAVW